MNSFVRRLKLPFHYGKLLLLILQCKLLKLAAFIRSGCHSKTILTLPHKPHPHSSLYKICHRLGYRVTRNARGRADLVIYWEDCTFRSNCEAIERLAENERVVNLRSKDIGKHHVADVFQNVFGYNLEVNPGEYRGPMVVKADRNACSVGEIIYGPADEKPGFVYQRLINNIVDGFLEEIRVPVFGSLLPYCLLQRIPLKYRFTLERGSGVICEVNEVLGPTEIDLIRRFCNVLGLDYGELDVLRDADDQRLYIVDVNNTPFGPMNRRLAIKSLFDRISWNALGRMCDAFELAFGNTARPSYEKSRC
jgi:hypothetical protein